MANNCEFCARIAKTIDDHNYYAKQACKNGRSNIERCSTKFVAAFCEKSYFDGEPNGKYTVYFDELRFCPLCATDLRPLLKTVIDGKGLKV